MNGPFICLPADKVEKIIASIDRLSELIQKMDDHRRENETVDMIMDGIISELQADVAKRAAEPVFVREFESKRHAELQEAVTRIEQNRRLEDQKAASRFCEALMQKAESQAMDRAAHEIFGGLWE